MNQSKQIQSLSNFSVLFVNITKGLQLLSSLSSKIAIRFVYIYIYLDLLVLVPVALLILKHGKINKGTRSPAVSATYNKPGLPGLGHEAC